jgi:Skp family chaperone for outer membrane proteins
MSAARRITRSVTRLNASNTLSWFGLSLALCLGSVAPSHAQSVWKWRDASGAVQLSDRPPPKEIPEKDILLRPASAVRAAAEAASASANAAAGPGGAGASLASAGAASAPAASASTDKELEARKKRNQEEQQAARKAQDAEQKQKQDAAKRESCERARNYLAALDSGQRIGRFNSKGEREVLDDTARAEERVRTQEQIDQNCR